MKLLLDENLSRKLVARLTDLYPGSLHVSEVNLATCDDRLIWDYAGKNGFVIVTRIGHFVEDTDLAVLVLEHRNTF